jgi:hypothetical protein
VFQEIKPGMMIAFGGEGFWNLAYVIEPALGGQWRVQLYEHLYSSKGDVACVTITKWVMVYGSADVLIDVGEKWTNPALIGLVNICKELHGFREENEHLKALVASAKDTEEAIVAH